jgi:hypothetical protein
MGRPRKIIEPEQKRSDEWKLYYSASISGLIAKSNGLSIELIMRMAKEYADEAEKAATL